MEENEENHDIQQTEPSLPTKLCGVCGDKALGYNFKAITCESCKAFFRRNALANKEFKCPFRDQCQITVLTRRFCQKCRLEKCLAIGMLKDCIMSEEDRTHKRLKIAENRAKRKVCETGFEPNYEENTSSKLIKREDDDSFSSNNSVKQASDITETSETPDKSNNATAANYFDSSSSQNQTVSVIKNNNVSNQVNCDQNKYNAMPIEFGSNSENLPLASLQSHASLSFGHIISNGIQTHLNDQSPPNGQSLCSAKDQDNTMIRHILTKSPPVEDTSKLFTALTNNNPTQQAACDSSSPSSTQGLQHKENVARDVLQDIDRIQVEPKSMKLILCEAIKLEFETYTSLAQINSSSRELNDAERARLNELIVANKALLAPLDDYMTGLVSDENGFKPSQGQNDPMLLSIINLTAVAIKRLIKMAKKINAFKNMCEEDQVALLKGGCTEMMILRSTMTYDCARDTWKVPHSQESLSSIKAEVLKLAKGNIYQEHDRFVRTFDAKWRTDENIILIMSAIVLFTPNRQRVVHSDVIKLEQNSYYYLLRRYLESVYPGCEAKSTFLKLIQKIMELQKLAEEVIGVYLDVNPRHVEPLLIEIFDLKPPHQ